MVDRADKTSCYNMASRKRRMEALDLSLAHRRSMFREVILWFAPKSKSLVALPLEHRSAFASMLFQFMLQILS